MPSGPHAGNRSRPAYSGQQRFRFPKQVIQLFAPRKPIDFKPPPRQRKLRPMIGLAAYVSKFESTKEKIHPTLSLSSKDKSQSRFETPAQRRLRARNETLAKLSELVNKRCEQWDPKRDESRKTKNAYNTLFVSNVPYQTTEKRLQDEFEAFGSVISVIMPKNREGVPTGYAFVEFERARDTKVAWREANGLRIDGRRVLVDVERGRTVEDWLPNRLDGPNNSCTRNLPKTASLTTRVFSIKGNEPRPLHTL